MRIANFPLGLLDALGIKSEGRSPAEFLDQVRGSFELRDLYLANDYEGITTTGDVVAVGQTSAKAFNFSAAAGEVIVVHRLSVLASTAAGEAVSLYPTLTMYTFSVALGPNLVLGASTNGYSVVPPSPPLILVPGARLGIWGTSATGVPSAGLNLLITRLRQ